MSSQANLALLRKQALVTLSPTRAGRRQLLLAAAASPLLFGVPRLLRAQDGPLKIALLTSLSGPFASLGESMRAGLELMLQQCNYEMGGRKVQLLVEDDHGKPDEAIRKVRKLIERDKIDILGGVISANIALAIRDIVHDAQLPTFISNAAANGLAREAASPYVFRPTKTSWMLGHTGALWTFEHIEKSGGITLGSDYTAGREYIDDFANTYQEQGGTLGERIWTPLGTPDFAPILMNLAASNPKFVYTFLAGADAVRFHQQMQDYQLHGKIQIVGPGALFDQEDVITAVGEAALGGVSTFHQSPGAQAAQDFVAAYQASRGRLPGEASTSGYVTGQVIKAGLDAVKGDLSNKAVFKQALLDKPINTAFGPMAFDPRNNQSILDIYVNRVEKDAQGRPFNTVVHTYQRIQDPGPRS